MTHTPPDQTVVRNASRRPVELHLGTTTVVLLPGETYTVAIDDRYCAALLRRGVLARHATPPPPAPRKATESTTTKKSATKKSTTKRAATKTSTAKATTAISKAAPPRTDPSA
jgi:hypothetical protein